MEGVVYVVSNEVMPNLVKVGFTLRPIAERLSELSAVTGVPQPFKLELACRVAHAPNLEKHAHARLREYAAGKEFFRCTPELATHHIKLVAIEQGIEIFDSTGPAAGAYLTSKEEAAAAARQAQARAAAEAQRREAAAARARETQQAAQVVTLTARFKEEARPAAFLIQKYSPPTGSKSVLGFLRNVTIGLMDPPPAEWGAYVAQRLLPGERRIFVEFLATVNALYTLENKATRDQILRTRGDLFSRAGAPVVTATDTLVGVWTALKLKVVLPGWDNSHLL